MPCEHYQDALVVAAASGAAPEGELISHLDTCSSCCVVFAREQFLFAAIDSGLNALANAEVPLSFSPRVRVSIAESPEPTRRWLPSFAFAAAIVAVVLAFFFALRPFRPIPVNQAHQRPNVPQALPPTVTTNSTLTSPTFAASVNLRPSHQRASAGAHLVVPSQPEVIVPADEREGYALLLATLQQRFEVSDALASTIYQKQEPSKGAKPLEIAQLEIKPLERQDSSTSNQEEK